MIWVCFFCLFFQFFFTSSSAPNRTQSATVKEFVDDGDKAACPVL